MVFNILFDIPRVTQYNSTLSCYSASAAQIHRGHCPHRDGDSHPLRNATKFITSLRVHSIAQVSFVRDTLPVPSTKTAAPARRNAGRCVHVQTVQRECAEGGMPTFRQTAAVNARKCKSHGSPYAAVLHEPAPGRHSILAMDAVPAPPAPSRCISAKQTRPRDGSS